MAIGRHASPGVGVILFAACLSVAGCRPGAEARFERRVEWIGNGVWIKAGLHTHSRASDGSARAAHLVRRSADRGCDAVAITDHSDLRVEVAEYRAAIEQARAENETTLVIAGIEWNLPPHDGAEHVNVLLPEGPAGPEVLAAFADRFDDDDDESPREAAVAAEALEWLSLRDWSGSVGPVLFLAHPGRKRDSADDVFDEMIRLRALSPFVAGFVGAPGHQKHEPYGFYEGRVKLVDRWDPAAAEVGGVWDRLLAEGQDVWAALAVSDFHNPRGEFWPGEFSETWVYAPERTVEGLLRALRAGSFFGVHGHLVREVELQLDAPGLDRPAGAGEVVSAPTGSLLKVELRLVVPSTDWRGEVNRLDRVELISVTAGGAEVVSAGSPRSSGPAISAELRLPEGGVVLRARGHGDDGAGSRLWFYTNPVRVVAR